MSTIAGSTNSSLLGQITSAPWAKRRESDQHNTQASGRARRVARLRLLARLMDNAFEIPGTRIRFGLDSLIGLVPGAGDAITAAISIYIVCEAAKLGASRAQLSMMLANIAIDAIAGSIPIVGDIFDLTFKANVRNLRMLGIEPTVSS